MKQLIGHTLWKNKYIGRLWFKDDIGDIYDEFWNSDIMSRCFPNM